MLIWKTIKANPGITRDELWTKVEDGIPPGYAMRRYAAELNAIERRTGRTPNGSGVRLTQARGYVLTHVLARMRGRGSVIRKNGCYSALKQPQYLGNPDMIDHTGTKAAEHMATADALRTLEKTIARAKPNIPHQSPVRLTQKEYDALVVAVKALRAAGSSGQVPD